MNILGISAFYHDSAACLVRDGEVVAAAQEERFTRKKHDAAFPTRAIEFCLRQAGITAAQVDHVAFYDKPVLKFDRLLETYLAFAPTGFRSFRLALPIWLQQKLHITREIREGLKDAYRGRVVYLEHHESHAASAFLPSPFEHAAIMTLDGVGEWSTGTLGVGKGNRIELGSELRFPHSLGLLYSAFTYFCGFKVNSGEYKLMGLAPYGQPRYTSVIREHLMDLKADGSFRLDLSYFNYCQGLTMTTDKMASLFGGPARAPESPLTQREMDIAASIQEITEEIVLAAARHLAKETGARALTMAGGVALNCVANGKLQRAKIFDHLWVQPAAGDAGAALGAALFVWHQLLDRPRRAAETNDAQQRSLLGPSFTDADTRATLDSLGAVYEHFDDETDLLGTVASEIANEQVVGMVQGRMEFGPRALGNRSILGDARSPKMQSVMNLKIKFRESFRPFAPSVLAEDAASWFHLEPGQSSPYMLLVAPVREEHRIAVDVSSEQLTGIDKLKVVRSTIPAVTHVDYSARIQTVDRHNGRYYRLLTKFKELTGCPMLINTSFNIRGEPIVCTPEDAYRCFLGCDIDLLVIDNFVLRKRAQPRQLSEQAREQYKQQFTLD
jgi:carbamoyltransferase